MRGEDERRMDLPPLPHHYLGWQAQLESSANTICWQPQRQTLSDSPAQQAQLRAAIVSAQSSTATKIASSS